MRRDTARRQAKSVRRLSATVQIVLLTLAIGSIQARADTAVAISEAQQELIVGKWRGTFESKSVGGFSGPSHYADTVRLDVFGLTEGAQFSMPGSGTWRTGVILRDGKILMTFGRATRPFSLERDGQGQLLLKLNYETQFNMSPSYATVVLKKQ